MNFLALSKDKSSVRLFADHLAWEVTPGVSCLFPNDIDRRKNPALRSIQLEAKQLEVPSGNLVPHDTDFEVPPNYFIWSWAPGMFLVVPRLKHRISTKHFEVVFSNETGSILVGDDLVLHFETSESQIHVKRVVSGFERSVHIVQYLSLFLAGVASEKARVEASTRSPTHA